MPKFTDSHCHLASHKFTADEIGDIIQRAEDQGIHRIITLATCLDDIATNLALSEQYPQLFFAAGIHPCDVHQTSDDYLRNLKKYAAHPRCVAIGETGLDYFHPAPDDWTSHDYHSRQREFLEAHFQLASDLNKNIVIHTRDKSGKQSLDDAVAIYTKFADKVHAVFHCFLGPIEHAQAILDLGGYLSYTGISTFKSAQSTLNAAAHTPDNRIMIETDSPYLAPVPYRGTRNEPSYIYPIAAHLSQARGQSLKEFSQITEANVNRFFRFPAHL